MPKVIKVIYSEDRIGAGTQEDPIRLRKCYHNLNGTEIFWYDPHLDKTYLDADGLEESAHEPRS